MTTPACSAEFTVLNINKFFYPRAGAETAFFSTRALLQGRGHQIVDFAMQDDANVATPYLHHFAPHRSYESGGKRAERVTAAFSSIYSPSARKALIGLLDDPATPHPDVAHLHNIYHQLTPSIIDELDRRGIPIVMTVHDWKIACPAYTLYRDGAPCRDCVRHRTYASAVRHSCLKDSRAGSLLAAAESTVARARHSYSKVQRFISPSRFGAEILREAGIDPARVEVLPNFLGDAAFAEAPRKTPPADTILFAGRLEETKGVDTLLAAWSKTTGARRLVIAGVGPMESAVRAAAAADGTIEYLGFVSREQVDAHMKHAAAVVLPANWEENCPMIVLEAQAQGVPVIGTDLGGLPDLITNGQDGLLVPAGDADRLAKAFMSLLQSHELSIRLGATALERAKSTYTADGHYKELQRVYQLARSERVPV